MKKNLAFGLLIAAITTSAFAEESAAPVDTVSGSAKFIGGDIGSVSGYLDTTGTIVSGLIANGWTSASAAQSVGASTYNIHGGKWLSDTTAWEVGYNSFGSVPGSFSASTTTQRYSGTNSYSATNIYAAILKASRLGSGKAYAKAGLHSTSTKTEYNSSRYSGTTLTGVGSGSTTKSNMGFVLGAGYEYPFSSTWAVRFDINMFTNAQFANVWNFAIIETKTLVQSSVGVNYNF